MPKIQEKQAHTAKQPRRNGQQAKALMHSCGPTLLAFVLLYKALFDLAVAPLGRAVWAGALALSPTKYILGSNLLSLFRSPLVVLAVLVVAVGYAFWALLEISGILICLEYGRQGRSIGLVELLRRAVANLAHVLLPKNLPLLAFAALVVPFTDLVMTSQFISQLAVPEYIMEVIRANPLYLGAFVVVTVLACFWTVEWMFVFHYFLLEKCSLKQAATRSRVLVRGRRMRSFLLVIWWKVRMQVKYALLTALPVAAIALALHFLAGNDTLLAAWQLTCDDILGPVINYLVAVIVTFTQYAYLSALYHRYKAEDGEPLPTLPPQKTAPAGKKPGRRSLRWLPMTVSAVVAVVALFSTAAFGVTLYAGGDLDLLFGNPTVVTAHRGYSAKAPENTLPAFQAAIDCGKVTYGELDVAQTSDGVVVLTHDVNLKRCTGVNVNVYDITYAELQKLDAGSSFSAEFAGTPIPTLDEVIKLCKGRLKLNIEIKNNGHSPTLESEVVRIIHENDFGDECVLTSLSYDSLAKVKALDESLKTGYILAMGAGNYYDLPAADIFSVETTFVTPGMVEQIHDRGKQVYAWTVDQEGDARRMLECGVDSIITGDPELIYRIIHEQRDNIASLLHLNGTFTLSGNAPDTDAPVKDLETLLEGA